MSDTKEYVLHTTRNGAGLLHYSFRVTPAEGLTKRLGGLSDVIDFGRKLKTAATVGEGEDPSSPVQILFINGESELMAALWGQGEKVIDTLMPRSDDMLEYVQELNEKFAALKE